MDWMNQLSGVLNQYAGTQPQGAPSPQTQQPNPQVEEHFDQVAQAAPPQALAQGLAATFISPQTPPFGTMTSQLFGQSNPQQQAGLLNTLISAAGPTVMSQLMNRSAMTGGQSGGALGNLGGLLGMLGGGASNAGGQQAPMQMPQITPEQAAQVPPEAIEELASHAQQHNPSIVDNVSQFYAQQPALVKGLGAAALITMLAKMASGHN